MRSICAKPWIAVGARLARLDLDDAAEAAPVLDAVAAGQERAATATISLFTVERRPPKWYSVGM